jgi:hypothetical protein
MELLEVLAAVVVVALGVLETLPQRLHRKAIVVEMEMETTVLAAAGLTQTVKLGSQM